jgi:hypothetical protein
MALSSDEQATILNILTREGRTTMVAEIAAVALAYKKNNSHTTVNSAITTSVSNWSAIHQLVDSPTDTSMMMSAIATDIGTAMGSNDASNLGPLLISLYASVKDFLGL